MKKLRVFALTAAWASFPAIAAAEEIAPSQTGPISIEKLADVNRGWGMAYLPDGRLLVTELSGNLRVFSSGKLGAPMAGVPPVAFYTMSGLLDVAVDPKFRRNGLIYMSYVEPAETQPPDAQATREPRFGNFLDARDIVVKGLAVARARLVGDELLDVKVIWRQAPKMLGRAHFGGRLLILNDGSLFVTSGDRQRFEPAQDPTSSVGKVIHIDTDGSIPAGNPFLSTPSKLPDVWTSGHRNSLGIALQPQTKKLWAVEMGPKGGDELNIIEKGLDYGWPSVSEGVHYNGDVPLKHSTNSQFKAPVYVWTPSVAPSGLAFYRGKLFHQWRGNLIAGGLISKALIRLTIDGEKVVSEERIDMKRRIRDFIEAPDGALLLLTDYDAGELLRLAPAVTR